MSGKVFLKSTMLFAMLYLLATISVECKGCTSRPRPTQYSRVQGRETSARAESLDQQLFLLASTSGNTIKTSCCIRARRFFNVQPKN